MSDRNARNDDFTRRVSFALDDGARPFYGCLMRRIAFSLLAAGAAWLLGALPSLAREPAAETRQKPAAAAAAPAELPLDRDGAALITIATPGRYSIRARTPTGARIELVDMIAGPLDASGAAGLRDGRIDALLDKGVYKLRVGAVKDAKGKASVSVAPFVEAGAARPVLQADAAPGGELGDLQQRSYTLDVAAEETVYLEAIGRALQDLRVWQADGALADLAFERSTIETKPGRPMNRLRLEGKLPAGHYIVTAYGGEPLVWADGGGGQPFLLRRPPPALLAAGVASGVIGPFGSVRYEAPANDDSFRLELPQPAPARLEARRGAARETVALDKNSRTGAVILRLAADDTAPVRVELSGFEGQAYTLRALRQSSRDSFEGAGPHLVSIDVAGEGGDEAPLTALLARVEKDGRAKVLAADLPRVGAGKAWRGRFNLSGSVSLLFEATRDGPVAVDAKGVKLRAAIEPAFGNLAPRSDGKDPARYDLVAGYYRLTLEPLAGAGGVLDVTIGPPGLTAPQAAPAPPRARLSFGQLTLERDGSYLVLTNAAPQMLTGPRVVPLPADLGKGPLALHQGPGQEITLPLRAPKDRPIAARDAAGADVPLSFTDEKTENDQRLATVKIAAPEKERALGLFLRPAPAPVAAATENAPLAKQRAAAGRPVWFDLARDETKRLAFDVAQGGLYRIETLGRLKTALRVGSALAPKIGDGDANGPGANALVTTFLRAGAWRAAVTAKESEGHLGLAVTPATLVPTAKIVGKGAARATLAPGKGAVVPLDIPQAGDYRMRLDGLSRTFEARLEDADGWPLAPPGPFSDETRHFEAGAYRLVVTPADVEARMIARLAPVVAETALDGHGPHALPFGTTKKLQWREPQAKDAPRAPDVWRFTLAGDSDVTLSIGEGMIGDIVKGETEPVGKVAGGRAFKGRLTAGDYRVEAGSLAHDDRLDYTIALSSAQLQPGAPRRVELPARLDFSLAKEAVVDLSTFGASETIGALKTAAGDLVERLEPRTDDWNVALSRRLPAGDYRLELEAFAAAPGDSSAKDSSEDEQASDSAGEARESAEADAPGDGVEADAGEEDDSGVSVTLAILPETDAAPLVANAETTVTGAGARRLALTPAPEGTLALVAARSASEAALSIERRGADGVWRVIGADRGLAPVVAWPADATKSEWRATVWSADGAGEPVVVAARALDMRARAPGDIAFDAVEGVSPPLCAAKIDTPEAALAELATTEPLLAGSAPGHALRGAHAGALAPQATATWLLTRDCKTKAHIAAFEWRGAETALDIGAGERAHLPAGAPAGKMRLWLARSTFAQPAIDAGAGMGVAPGAAIARAGDAAPQMWNADGAGAFRATLSALDIETRAAVSGDALFAGVIPPMSAQPIDMAAPGAPLALDLAGGLVAFLDDGRGVFGDGAGVSRTLHKAGARVLIANTTDRPAPATLARTMDKSAMLDSATALKRFFGAAGQVSLPVEARKGDRLLVIGADAAFVAKSGRVMRGVDLALDGPGELTLDFKPGLVAAWIERDGAAPWPRTAARALQPPQRVTLEGPAMRFTLKRDAPGVIAATGDAPALIVFSQNGRRETFAFPSGVAFRHYVAAGEATLDIYAPHDGALSGALDVTTPRVIEAREGLSDAIAIAPGDAALFAFETRRDGPVGLGLRAEPDRVTARLFDAAGKTLGEGLSQLATLPPGRYFLEARAPADAGATTVRAAIVGVSPPPAAPPEEAIADLLDKAGMKKSK